MKETTRERLVTLLDELEIAAMEYEHGSSDDRGEVIEARLRIIGLFESLEPKEEP